jgi:hypothetical protein
MLEVTNTPRYAIVLAHPCLLSACRSRALTGGGGWRQAAGSATARQETGDRRGNENMIA